MEAASSNKETTTSLEDLPDEVLFVIIEQGTLGTLDGFAIRWTSQRLKRASECTSFWLCIAKNLARQRPLPLPAFRSLASLSLDELQKVCIQHHMSTINLASEAPQFRRHHILTMKGHPDTRVTDFAFLPGGRHALVLFKDRKMELWDICKPQIPSVVVHDERDFRPVGILLGSYSPDKELPPNWELFLYDIHTHGVNESIVTVSVIYCEENRQDDSETDVIKVISFEIAPDGASSTIVEHFSLTTGLGAEGVALYVRAPLVVILNVDGMVLTVANYLDHRMCVVSTTIPNRGNETYDMAITEGGDIFLHGTSPVGVMIHAYFDAPSLLSNPDLADASALEPRPYPPDCTGAIDFDPRCRSPETYRRIGLVQPRNAPNPRTGGMLPIVTVMQLQLDAAEEAPQLPWTPRKVVSVRLDIEYAVHWMKSGQQQGPEPVQDQFQSKIRPTPSNPSLFREVIVSSCARHVAWIDEDPLGLVKDPCLLILSIPSAQDEESPPPRPLAIPFNLRSLYCFEFCDESTTLAIISKDDAQHRSAESTACVVHLFSY